MSDLSARAAASPGIDHNRRQFTTNECQGQRDNSANPGSIVVSCLPANPEPMPVHVALHGFECREVYRQGGAQLIVRSINAKIDVLGNAQKVQIGRVNRSIIPNRGLRLTL